MTTTIASPFADPSELNSPIDWEQLDELIQESLAAKEESARQKAIYDTKRDQICAILRGLNEKEVKTSVGKVRIKETPSGWTFSAETEALKIQLAAQQQIEKKNGTAQPASITVSADVFPL